MKAVLKHELSGYFHSLTAYVFGAFLLVFVGIGSMLYNIQQAVANFEYVLGFISLIFVGLVPILTMRVLAEERKQRTDQLLYSLPITTTDIILGKYLALLVVFLIPLVVGVGVATSVETAALLSKKALMRPLGSHNENERAASMEKLLEDGINEIGLGPQGMGGKYSVMGVHIENTARHPSAIGVAVNVGCWSHRRGHIIFDKDLNYTITTHSGVTL